MQALIAAGYTVYAINPRQVARYRERYGTSGAKSDAGDAHTLAGMVAFGDLTAPDALELLGRAPDPASGARLSRAQITAALTRARRRQVQDKAAAIAAALRTVHLAQPPAVAAACAATVRSLVAMTGAFNAQIVAVEEQVKECFGHARDAEIYLSQPGLGQALAARALGECGDDEHRYATAKNRKNYAATSPITRACGKKKTVLARHIHNDRLAGALHQQACCALSASPGARAYHDQLRARGHDHHAALRQLANRLVGILHGCLKTGTTYHEHTAWTHHNQNQQTAA